MRWIEVIAVVAVLGAAATPGRAPAGTGGTASARSRSAAKPAAAKTRAERAIAAGWPASREGELAYGWVDAFGRGEAAMRTIYLEDLAEKSRAEKSMEARLARYRELREKFGRLTLGSVVKAAPGELTVRLIDSDAATHTFVFKAETSPPYRLLSVGIQQRVPGGHGGGHGGWNH